MPQLDFATYSGQLFWLAISFMVLYMLVSRLILPSIASVVEVRAKNISDNLSSAEAANNKSEEFEGQANKTLAESASKARGLIAEASARAKVKIDAKRTELAISLDKKTKAAEAEIARIEQESAAVVVQLSKDLANQIANKIINRAA